MKEKRKTRLNKTQGTKTEFVGFGAFADDAAPSPTSENANAASKANTLRWSPIYAGKDSHLSSLVFPRLIKRDSTTKVKALQELQEYFQKDSLPKKQQVDALSHYVFLYYSKLSYDSSSSVRAEALFVLTLAAIRVPKAFQTLVQQNRQVLGMMYCCHGDPAAEVRAVARKYLKDETIKEEESSYSQEDLEAGIWEYVERILSYGRAKAMHEDLFATSLKSSNSGSGGKGGKEISSEDLNETQRDQLEERFERIVGSALSGMQMWIQSHGITESNNTNHDVTNSAFLWKTLSSPKVSLRRKTYQLFGICCQKAPVIIFGRDQNNNTSSFAQTLPQALASEKEPGNITPLLEALLGYLAAFSKYNSGSSPWDTMNASTVTKHLVKTFKKSCYGDSAWGPTLLPLLSMLPSIKDQVAVLSAAWRGREQAVRLGDQMVVATTVSESASYFLLRKGKQQTENADTNEEQGEETDAKVLAQLWVDTLNCFLETKLTSKATAGPAHQAQLALGEGLAREIQHFDNVQVRQDCAFYPIQEWFWKDKVRPCILESEGDEALAKLVGQITRSGKSRPDPSPGTCHYLSSILREKFHKVLSNYQQTSGAVPSSEAYNLMIMIITHEGLQVLNPSSETEQSSEKSVEKFLMNDVLRWMVIHTSTLSTQKQTTTLAENDFTIYGICAVELPFDKRQHTWNSLLREIIAAKCDLELLVAGLKALLRKNTISVDEIRCHTLDDFAADVVRGLMVQHKNDESSENHHPVVVEGSNSLKGFLSACAGLSPGVPPLVGTQVLSEWVDRTCPQLGTDMEAIAPSVVLETLLNLASSERILLSHEEFERVILQSWQQGGYIWNEVSLEMLIKERGYCIRLLQLGSDLLRGTLKGYSKTKLELADADADYLSRSWSEKAWRLLDLSKRATPSPETSDTEFPAPSLALVHLADQSLWESAEHAEFLFSCLMYLFRHIQESSARLYLLQASAENKAADLAVAMFLALSEASADATVAARASRRKDRCAQLLAALGGRQLENELLVTWLKSTVSLIEKFIETKDYIGIRKGVGVVSQFIDLMLDRVTPSDVFNASDDGEDLRDEFKRDKVARIIVPILNRQTFASLPWNSSFAELANVVISQCGLGEERGIGSLHYDTFQLILGADNRLRNLLSDDSKSQHADQICQELWLLSLSCGFGLSTPASTWNSQLLLFDADKVTTLLFEYIDEGVPTDTDKNIDRAVLAWLVTASPALKDAGLGERAVTQIYKSCLTFLDSVSDGGLGENMYHALHAISTAKIVTLKEKVNTSQLEIQAMMKMMKLFTCDWENHAERRKSLVCDFDENCEPQSTVQPEWRSLCYFPDIMNTLTHDANTLVAASLDYADELVKGLFIESKRWFAFRTLNAIALAAEPFNDPVPDELTARRVSEWTKDLDSEEKDEFQEDIEIVSETLPHRLMTEMEFWAEEEVAETLEDSVIIGRAMVWLICLRFIDASIQKDASFRPSFCSYIDKCEAVESILNLKILHTGIGTDGKNQSEEKLVEMNDLLKREETIESTTLAAVVLFRTVEALPSLSRRWWEDECPRVYTSPIRDYIETQVAPVILRSELERIKRASIQNSFGAMTVTGSVTTREITATYAQDEIKLKVQIKLPSCFPLRSAEVDCSQTLGVPQKRWKLWSLQITQMLNNQGGTLHEALMLWKENVDKEFEGVEPCPVCYSVLHVKNHKLPELECTTCSNRFHVSCLTQWFKSSGKTQCVICQQPWVGTRVKK